MAYNRWTEFEFDTNFINKVNKIRKYVQNLRAIKSKFIADEYLICSCVINPPVLCIAARIRWNIYADPRIVKSLKLLRFSDFKASVYRNNALEIEVGSNQNLHKTSEYYTYVRTYVRTHYTYTPVGYFKLAMFTRRCLVTVNIICNIYAQNIHWEV